MDDLDLSPFLLSLGVLPVVLCIASETLRGLILTCHKILVPKIQKLNYSLVSWEVMMVTYFPWRVESIIIGSGSHSPHGDSRRAPVA